MQQSVSPVELELRWGEAAVYARDLLGVNAQAWRQSLSGVNGERLPLVAGRCL